MSHPQTRIRNIPKLCEKTTPALAPKICFLFSSSLLLQWIQKVCGWFIDDVFPAPMGDKKHMALGTRDRHSHKSRHPQSSIHMHITLLHDMMKTLTETIPHHNYSTCYCYGKRDKTKQQNPAHLFIICQQSRMKPFILVSSFTLA